ncbi:hypothetical protein AB9K26_00675 [Psychroserpens sp. XS_ASV72]|uniref:hypothetical protein n=1 Tax=Psychroserpens sp. XS_ASV72 TaxID=3241293 RepID=UPI003511F5EC
MKKIFYLFILFISQSILSQSQEYEKIFWDLVDVKLYPDTYTEIGYTKKINFDTFSLHLKLFKKRKTLTYNNGITKEESITFSKKEKRLLIRELKKSKTYTWNLSNEKELIQVESSNALNFLMVDRNRELRIISKPIFIRDNEIVCLFSSHFCCGHYYGHATLCLYKKVNGKWKRWIHLTHGDY